MIGQLPDQAARDAILTDLDHNLVVEAAAGTGKTTCLVGRLVNLSKAGALAGSSRLAAVTFTLKAAAELRERLAKQLAESLAEPGLDGRERRNLELAAQNLPDCHIGTIHSFCAKLLRERPVEAGVSPDFQELEEDDDTLLRRRAWEEFARELHSEAGREMRTAFEIFGLDLDTMGEGFLRYAEYPDIADWPGIDASLDQINVAGFMQGVHAYRGTLANLRPLLDGADCGTDKLLPILQVLDRRCTRLPPVLTLGVAFNLCRLLKDVDKPVQTWWKQFGVTGPEAKELVEAYSKFCEDRVKPFRNACLAAVYAQALQAYRHANDIYDRLRRENGVLNFQDLLMTAAGLVRDFPEVRDDLASRYARLLVDEVQDTDPVQAELMFLLASADAGERNWRRCRPRPGALFIVGDPKQSIYRFRRADIVVYQEIKNRIVASGGQVLGLSANFRSQPCLLDWVNTTFSHHDDTERTPEAVARSGKFASDESEYSPAYVPLQPGREPAGDDAFRGVYSLDTVPVKKGKTTEADVVRDEALRIASFIRHAVDTGLPIPDGDATRPARPGDFLIVTYRKSAGATYADAVRRMGLDAHLSSGGTLIGSDELALLADYLDALAQPDDGIKLLVVLRGGLFGVSDEELYAWKKADMAFSFLAPLSAAPAGPVADALALMRRHYGEVRNTVPAQALDAIAADLGLWARAGLADDAPRRAGVLATAMELVKTEREAIPTLGKLAERLRWHLQTFEDEPLTAAATQGQAVRVMNLHKTKGLEAPVVFLTSTRTVRTKSADFAIRREGDRTLGGMCLKQGEHGNVVLARPYEWDDLAAKEDLFLAAERTRLNYVAATRAGAALVVSVHKTTKGWKTAFLPEYQPGVTIEQALPEPSAEWRGERLAELEGEKGGSVDAAALAEAEQLRRQARLAMTARSYAVERAKPDSGGLGGLFAPPPVTPWEAEADRDMGEVVHRLLALGGNAQEMEDEAARLLRDHGLPAADAADVAHLAATARRSTLWQRAEASEKRLREAPYAVWLDDDHGGRLQRGVIDLVFKEADGWVVVDYKTDSLPHALPINEAAARHADQVRQYRAAWEQLTGEPVKEALVYFIRRDVAASV
ncbi:MAG: UvrD-helicase domain-containing protein [Planctomycetaceae bacterium]|nr:UvrD-helicase domain-containing protein [Planctomycetaceae bacterium]